MKYVVFSFDDGRKDFYKNALPILKKYNLTATVNIISDFVRNHAPSGFLTSENEFMTLDEIKEASSKGIEIGNHSKNHTNELEMIESFRLNDKCLDENKYGFASPGSYVCDKNIAPYYELVKDGRLLYIRSGRQIRRDGFFHAVLYVLLEKIKSPFLFWLYQKRNIIDIEKEYKFYPTIAVDSFTTVKQIEYTITRMKGNKAAIFMFHSVIPKTASGYGKDKWFNDIEDFEELCKFCAEHNDFQVVTNKRLDEIIGEEKLYSVLNLLI